MIDPETIPKLLAAGTIEVAPLAYMRGRAQPYDAKVLTPTGWPMGDLAVGDLVIGSNGLPTPVLGIYPQGPKPVYRVSSQDGASTLACGEHLWTVTDARGQAPRPDAHPRDPRDDRAARRGAVRRYELPLVEPVEFEPQDVPIDPYALGLLLGDGCLTTRTTPSFTTADSELAVALEAALDGIELTRKGEATTTCCATAGARGGLRIANPVTVALRELGLAGPRSSTKFVPEPTS